MVISPKDIAAFIIETVMQRRTITGVNLGQALHREFPMLRLQKYGGLNRFIRKYCANEVESNSYGVDFVYTSQSGLDEENLDAAPVKLQESAWTIFSSSGSASSLMINRLTGEISVNQNPEPLPEGFILIQPMSSEDYRMMLLEFMPRFEESMRVELLESLADDDFMQAVSDFISKHREEFKEWEEWSNQKILELLKSNLQDSGLAEDAITLALDYFQKSKVESTPADSEDRQEQRARISPRKDRRKSSVSRSNNSHGNLRKIIHEAVDHMDEEEMRRIWLPVGLVFDSFKKTFQ